MKKVLTIAGSDSGGGAGIQADLKTFTVLGVFGMSAITALTAQNTRGVAGIHPVPPEFVRLQIDTVLSDLGADAGKTGMLFSAPIIREVCQAVREHGLRDLVVDPVMVAKSGHRLLEEDAVRALAGELLPLARVVTPNVPEAEILSGVPVRDAADLERCARAIGELGPACVVVKGGHLQGPAVDAVLWEGRITFLEGRRLPFAAVHGTGCTFSAAIAAWLALGHPVPAAVRLAKDFVARAIATAEPLGGGNPPANQIGAAG
jgi:hydroxymethylpyrimidine/phosphomethylpyrimidine kinase